MVVARGWGREMGRCYLVGIKFVVQEDKCLEILPLIILYCTLENLLKRLMSCCVLTIIKKWRETEAVFNQRHF